MAPNFDPDKDIPALTDKVILLTGGTGGVGKTAVLELAKHNPAHIFFTGRNATAAAAVIEETRPHGVPVTFLPCELNSLASVRAAAASFVAQAERLDVFVANAGVMATPAGLSEDGFENQFATNHLGNAGLLMGVLPTMLRTAERPGADVRFVALTSLGYRGHPSMGINFATVRTTQEDMPLGPWGRYGQSKLANIVFVKELGRRHPQIATLAVHPGVVETELVTGLPFWKRMLVRVTNPLGTMTPREGSFNTLWAATGRDVRRRVEDEKGTALFRPVGKSDVGDKMCFDEALGKKLWEWTEEQVKE